MQKRNLRIPLFARIHQIDILPERINLADRIVLAKRVQVRTTLLLDRVARRPPPDIRAIVPECRQRN